MIIGVGALCHLQLAEQHRACFLQSAYNCRVVIGAEVCVDRHAGCGGKALGPEQVFDRNRDAVQRPAIMARRDLRLR